MPHGPGKYGANAEKLLEQFGGTLCAVIMNGDKGWGFDVATSDPLLLRELPAMLREMADSIDQDVWHGGKRAFN